MEAKVDNTFKGRLMPSEARPNFFLKFKKVNILLILIITVKIFPCAKAKFPVFSLSGKSKNQIPCFPCAVATLYFNSQ